YYHGAAISRDGQFIAFGSGEYGGPAASVWRVDDGSLVTTVPSQYNTVFGLAITPDNNWLIIDNGHLELFAIPHGTPAANPPANVGSNPSIAYSSASNLIATAGNDQQISVWDSVAGKVLSQVNWTGTNPITGVRFSPNGATLAAGTDNKLTVW